MSRECVITKIYSYTWISMMWQYIICFGSITITDPNNFDLLFKSIQASHPKFHLLSGILKTRLRSLFQNHLDYFNWINLMCTIIWWYSNPYNYWFECGCKKLEKSYNINLLVIQFYFIIRFPNFIVAFSSDFGYLKSFFPYPIFQYFK